MRIVCDEPKRLENIRKHGFDFAALDIGFFEEAVLAPAKLRRLKAIGPLGDRLLASIFFALGREGISIISLRPASKLERTQYAQARSKPTTNH